MSQEAVSIRLEHCGSASTAVLSPAIRSQCATSYPPAASRLSDHTRHGHRRPRTRARPRLRGDPGARKPHARPQYPLLPAAARPGLGQADPAAGQERPAEERGSHRRHGVGAVRGLARRRDRRAGGRARQPGLGSRPTPTSPGRSGSRWPPPGWRTRSRSSSPTTSPAATAPSTRPAGRRPTPTTMPGSTPSAAPSATPRRSCSRNRTRWRTFPATAAPRTRPRSPTSPTPPGSGTWLTRSRRWRRTRTSASISTAATAPGRTSAAWPRR